MHNPVPASHALIGPDNPRPMSLSSSEPRGGFAPLGTRPAELAVTTVFDEVGRPLVGVFVPDGEVL